MALSLMPRLRNRLALLARTHMAKLCLNTSVASFTFDDFPASAYSQGGKILEEYGVKGTYFISGRFLNQTIDGVDYVSDDQLRLIHGHGHEIGCHTFDHMHLGAQSADFAFGTCEKNLSLLRKILGASFMMSSFAYPFGDASPNVKRVMAKQFGLCRGVRRGVNEGAVDLAQIRIISLEQYHWNFEAIEKIIAEARHKNVWIVFLSHDISSAPSAFGSTPEQMRKVLHALKQAAIPVKTLKAAAAYGIFGIQETKAA